MIFFFFVFFQKKKINDGKTVFCTEFGLWVLGPDLNSSVKASLFLVSFFPVFNVFFMTWGMRPIHT